MHRQRGGRQNRRSVPVEGQRRQGPHAVQFNHRSKLNASSRARLVDLTSNRRTREGQQQVEGGKFLQGHSPGPNGKVVITTHNQHEVFAEQFGVIEFGRADRLGKNRKLQLTLGEPRLK